MIGLESLEACLEGVEHAGRRARRELGADVRFVSLALEHPPHGLLAGFSRDPVAVRRVEVLLELGALNLKRSIVESTFW